jgi:hypothetical protein
MLSVSGLRWDLASRPFSNSKVLDDIVLALGVTSMVSGSQEKGS